MSKNQSTSNAPSNKVSVTFRVDKGVLEHNNRTFIAKNVVRERVPDNIIYKQYELSRSAPGFFFCRKMQLPLR